MRPTRALHLGLGTPSPRAPSRPARFATALARVGLGALAAVAIGAGCSTGADDAAPPGDTFIAFATNFTGYHDWSETVIEGTSTPASTHLAGRRVVYINKKPPAGSTEFPVGTIIVKELEDNADGELQVFGMVKRGGGYNSKGATDWEWFELQNLPEDKVKIVWHGVGPPAGEKYAGDPNGGCNVCHSAAAENDFVQTPALDLDSF
ncbi:MAG: hypothetical protein U0414_14370 [Polyangiaceae bacterium]